MFKMMFVECGRNRSYEGYQMKGKNMILLSVAVLAIGLFVPP